jgi:hypothetical protein
VEYFTKLAYYFCTPFRECCLLNAKKQRKRMLNANYKVKEAMGNPRNLGIPLSLDEAHV